MHARDGLEVRRIGRDGAADAAAVLGRAFVDDPSWRFVFPDDATRVARTARLLGAVIARFFVGLGEAWVVADAGATVATAIWAPPGRHVMPARTALALAPLAVRLIGRRLPRAYPMFRAMETRHPTEPHWYLAALGVDPAHQGRGHGARLLAPVLARADATRTLTWLESTNPRNHAFYRRMGFDVAEQVAIAGGPTITFFARAPR